MRTVLGICSVAMILLTTSLARAEQVDNPQFTAWQKFNVGSSASYTGSIDMSGMKMEQGSVRKLSEKTTDYAKIEVVSTVTVMGQPHSSPPNAQTITAKTEKRELKQDADEKVEAAGKSYDCKVFEVPSKDPKAAAGATMKIWANSDIPGGMVKMEVTTARGKITMLLQSFEAK